MYHKITVKNLSMWGHDRCQLLEDTKATEILEKIVKKICEYSQMDKINKL